MTAKLTPEEMRAWLDRKPPTPSWTGISGADDTDFRRVTWRDEWFDGDEYLGERSARVGPDDVGAAQRCGCEVCENGRDG
jgi:hypothetical protein